jgi:hypothetical protein
LAAELYICAELVLSILIAGVPAGLAVAAKDAPEFMVGMLRICTGKYTMLPVMVLVVAAPIN